MLRLALPNISNVWQITLKDTSLISVTGLVEIMRQSYIAAGSTRDPLFFYSFAALLYLILTFLSIVSFKSPSFRVNLPAVGTHLTSSGSSFSSTSSPLPLFIDPLIL